MTDRVMWFARGGAFARLGPFDSQIAAVSAMRLSPDERARTGQEFPDNVFVWPEVVRALKEAP